MRIIVLTSEAGWHVGDLARAARTAGHALVPASFLHLEGGLGDGGWVRARSIRPAGGPAHRPEKAPWVQITPPDRVIVRTMPAGSLEQVVFRMDVLHRLQRAGVPVLNPPAALECAVDKYLAGCRMQAAGVPVPQTVACLDWPQALEAFERLGGDVVVKPIFGSEGRGLTRVTDPDVAYRVFRTLHGLGAVLYLQEFVDHPGYDKRVLVCGGRVLGAIKRRHEADWRTNVARGSVAEPAELSDGERQLALRAAAAVAAPLAGVDLIADRDGRQYVLEVNAVPGWRALARVCQVDVAARVLALLGEI